MSVPDLAEITIEKAPVVAATATRGYWAETWRRFCKKKIAIVALAYVAVMAIIAVLSPMLVGTKPIVVKYKGSISFPAIGYFREQWETPLLVSRDLRKRYTPERLKEKDPESWAIWPLVFQDPYRRVRENELAGHPGNAQGVAPNQYNALGTNQEGIDVLAQIVHGTRIALLVGFVATGISAAIGIVLGAIAGYFGGWTDILLSRLLEIVLCIPQLVLILSLLAVVERATIWHMMVVLGLTGWPGIARLTRGEFLKLKNVDYVAAARAMGAGPLRIIFRHILPNALAPVLVPIAFGIAGAILTESGLSFLGFGSPPPNASWGTLLFAGQRNQGMWWLILFPGLAIFFTVLAYNLIGEALQEATDPRLRESQK
jgi:peptide/nickel transport system permease protein